MRAFACFLIALAFLSVADFVGGGRVLAMGPPSDPYWVMGALRMELGCISRPSWSPDGRSLAFVVESSDDYKMHIAKVDVATGSLRVFCRGWVPNWSPRGDLIAFLDHEPGKGHGLRVIPANGGSPRSMSAAPIGSSIVWSPDGRYLAFEQITTWESPPRYTGAMRISCGDVCIADTTSGVVQRLTNFARTFPSDAHCLTASPMGWTSKGELLVVVNVTTEDETTVDGLPGIYLLGASTRHLRKLFDGDFAAAMLSPDESEVVLTKERSRKGEFGFLDWQTEVLLGSLKEPRTRTVARTRYGEGFSDVSVSWSRRQVVGAGPQLRQEGTDRLSSHGLTAIQMDSGELRVLTGSELREGAPAVSPDGSRVAFYRRWDADRGLCVMNVDRCRARLVATLDP